MSQVLLSPPASSPLADHPPELRFLWLRHVARGGGAWCFRHSGRGYGRRYTGPAEPTTSDASKPPQIAGPSGSGEGRTTHRRSDIRPTKPNPLSPTRKLKHEYYPSGTTLRAILGAEARRL